MTKTPFKPKQKSADAAPVLPPAVEQYFVEGRGENIVYYPRLIAGGDVLFTSSRYNIEGERSVLHTVEFGDGPVAIDWDNAEPLELAIDDLTDGGDGASSYADCPSAASDAKAYAAWGKNYKRWLRQNEKITLYSSKRFRLTSAADETEGEFRARLQDTASEARDLAIAKIRKRYASKVTTLESRLMRAEQSIAVQKEQSTKKTLDTAVSFGTAILGAVFGRKRISSTSASKMGTAIRTAGGARKEAADVGRAKEAAAKVRADMADLSMTLEKEIADLDTAFDAQSESLKEIVVRAKSTDVNVTITGLVWLPYASGEKGRLRPAW
ncbi:MAG: hypothetical protein HQ492_00860 [Woeseiaceae bacterium]|nr:hypothetical protein [Woeseiaceae bacterium]